MKILVTGANGQLGSEIVRLGRRLGLETVGAGRQELDITHNEADRYIQEISPGILINTAAYTAVDKAEAEPAAAFAINRDGPARLAEICARQRIALLHLSTDYVFDGEKSTPYDENDRPNPRSIYGASKLEGELAVAQRLEQHLILRVAWVFGESGHNFVRTMLRLGKARKALRVVDDQRGCPTWAGDIAAALLNLAQQYRREQTLPWGTYHYAGAPTTTWHGFAIAIFDRAVELGLLQTAPTVEAIHTSDYPTPAPRPKNSVLECGKFERAFGIGPGDWNTGLRQVLNSWQ